MDTTQTLNHLRSQKLGLVTKFRKFTPWLLGLLLLVGVYFLATGQSGPPSIQSITLSTEPLFAAASGDKPTLALALSVEYPTVGAQYRESTYDVAQEYLGYYDADSCYAYNNAPTETAVTPNVASDYKRFDRLGPAVSRRCTGSSDGFSGNFLNFASSSSIDMLRLALSGGDRLVDTGSASSSQTILQRAVLSNGDPVCMWNDSSTFPAKNLPRDSGNYLGAVPTVMRTAANASTADIQIANTLNRIYFGTVQGGGCGNTSSYSLGNSSPPATQVLGQTYGPGSRPTGYPTTATCNNGDSCGGAGMNEILFGRSGGGDANKWVSYATFGAATCDASNFSGGSTSGNANCFVRPLHWFHLLSAYRLVRAQYRRLFLCKGTSLQCQRFRGVARHAKLRFLYQIPERLLQTDR